MKYIERRRSSVLDHEGWRKCFACCLQRPFLLRKTDTAMCIVTPNCGPLVIQTGCGYKVDTVYELIMYV